MFVALFLKTHHKQIARLPQGKGLKLISPPTGCNEASKWKRGLETIDMMMTNNEKRLFRTSTTQESVIISTAAAVENRLKRCLNLLKTQASEITGAALNTKLSSHRPTIVSLGTTMATAFKCGRLAALPIQSRLATAFREFKTINDNEVAKIAKEHSQKKGPQRRRKKN